MGLTGWAWIGQGSADLVRRLTQTPYKIESTAQLTSITRLARSTSCSPKPDWNASVCVS
jgi:hypothetical protein